jgi:hypothetical protein
MVISIQALEAARLAIGLARFAAATALVIVRDISDSDKLVTCEAQPAMGLFGGVQRFKLASDIFEGAKA